MADKSSPKDLEEWLKDKPKEWMQVLANRCALRVMPVLGSAIKHSNLSEVIINQLTLATMRASLTSEVATFSSALEVKGFANTAARVADAAGSTVAPAHSVFVAGSALDLGAARAAGAAVIVSARAIDAPSLTYDAALKTISAYIAPHGKNAADAVGLANVAAGAADTALEHDVRWLQNHGGYEYSPQNLLSTPLWQGTNNPLLLEWGSLKESLKSFDANWQFWIDWYQSKLDGTLHPGLTQVQQDELYYQIATFPNELWEEGAEAVNQRIAELMKEEAESASNDLVETIIAPDELDGAHLELSDGKFELAKSNSSLSKDFDEETQEILRNRIQTRMNMLSEQVSRVSNQHPHLDVVIKEYQGQLDNDLDELNSAEFWGHSVSLMAQAKAYLTQNTSGTMSPALEPNLCALLEEVSQLNGGFILGFPRGAELSKKANEAQLPTGFDQPSSELIKLLNDQKEIIGDKLSHLLTSISEAVDAGGWKFARLEYSAVSTLHNLLLSIGKTVIKFDQTILKSAVAVTVFSRNFPEINPATIQIIWDLLLGHPSLIAQFTAPFPELHKWMEYVIKRAEVLKTDNEINNKEE